jgi:4-amino-4-deoxy-L-arabinose transferase-like glycosyltransferase
MLKKFRKISLDELFVVLILGVASFLRFFRLSDLLGFWYDQGRDALVVWDMIYNGKFTLIGPMMGFTGIFRGGWYYWLIAPFYALGKGDPIFASVFLITISVIALYMLYNIGREVGGVKTGVLAILIASVSFYIIGASRWLADPTPTLLVSVLLVWSLYKFAEGKKWGLISAGFLAGMAMQFSAAVEIFYLPAIIAIVFLLRSEVKINVKYALLALVAYIIPFAPQLFFEIRHPGVQSGALINFLFHEKTFTYAFWEIVETRIPFDYNMLASKFWINGAVLFAPFFAVFLGLLIFNWKKLWSSDKFKIIFVLAVAPFFGTLFFVSNLGGVYDYYFTGYYLVWILLFSYVYIAYFRIFFVKLTLAAFLIVLIAQNASQYKNGYFISIDDPNTTSFTGQLKSIDWIYKDAEGRDFNFDVYVPPVVPYEFNYLFRWYGNSKYGHLPVEKNIQLLYTVYEVDAYHPERLRAWLDRQKGIGVVVKEAKFGGITVQERQRILPTK